MSNNEKIRGLTVTRITVYSLAAFLLAVMQTSSLGRLGLFGVHPQLALALVCASAYFCGSSTGAICGIVSGALTDALGGTGIPILALLYMITGYFIGAYTADRRQTRSSGSLVGWSLAFAVGTGAGVLITMLGLFINAGRPNIFMSLWHIALPEALNTYLFGWLIGVMHLAVQPVLKKSNTKGERS